MHALLQLKKKKNNPFLQFTFISLVSALSLSEAQLLQKSSSWTQYYPASTKASAVLTLVSIFLLAFPSCVWWLHAYPLSLDVVIAFDCWTFLKFYDLTCFFLLWLFSKKTLILLFWLFQLYTDLQGFMDLITMLLVLLSFSLSLKIKAFILYHVSTI